MADEVTVRPATDDDIGEILAVATRALGWNPTDPNEAFFRWKHLDNPAGRSPMWVAESGGSIAGFRTMLRWRYRHGDSTLRAVRAVDTATDPDHQRKGVFRLLTEAAVGELTADGVDFVFNTPNEKSRPGYLRMGWIDAGRLPAAFLPAGPASLVRLARARTAADKWSIPLSVGEPVDAVAESLTTTADGVVTDRTVEHLTWRYGFEPLHYRALQTDDAVAVIRLRRRGAAIEAVVADLSSPSAASTKRLYREIRRLGGVDYLLTLATPPYPAPRLPTIPGLGPHLTLRELASPPPAVARFRFSLGDIELF
ncbi:MAG: GNAT family N-acetyltransferase [Actinomycetota bacterium]